jgi:uncharacterized protein (TIGR00251 family)
VSPSTRVQLRVSPGARRARVVGRHGDAWKVRVAPAPEHGKANDAVVALLSDALSLPRAGIAIVSGHASRDKTVALEGIDPEQIERLLAEASAAGKDPSE